MGAGCFVTAGEHLLGVQKVWKGIRKGVSGSGKWLENASVKHPTDLAVSRKLRVSQEGCRDQLPPFSQQYVVRTPASHPALSSHPVSCRLHTTTTTTTPTHCHHHCCRPHHCHHRPYNCHRPHNCCHHCHQPHHCCQQADSGRVCCCCMWRPGAGAGPQPDAHHCHGVPG